MNREEHLLTLTCLPKLYRECGRRYVADLLEMFSVIRACGNMNIARNDFFQVYTILKLWRRKMRMTPFSIFSPYSSRLQDIELKFETPIANSRAWVTFTAVYYGLGAVALYIKH